jgi:hypothetical protein
MEDTSAHKALFRNDSTTGSGRYFLIRDDGLTNTAQTVANYGFATLTGMNNYTGSTIATLAPLIPFPRTIDGTDRHSDTFYGVVVPKGSHATSPWIVIADEYTCYVLVNGAGTSSFGTGSMKMFTFGDVVKFGDVSNLPRAYVAGAGFYGVQNGYSYLKSPGLKIDANSTGAYQIEGYLEHSITNASGSVGYYGFIPTYWRINGSCSRTDRDRGEPRRRTKNLYAFRYRK